MAVRCVVQHDRVRIIVVAASLVAALLVTASGSGGPLQQAALPAKIIFVNIGQGDAVVMRIGGKIIVSDTGQYDYEVLDEALRDADGLGAKRIDVLILGHAHDDHAKNAAELLRKWEVRRVVKLPAGLLLRLFWNSSFRLPIG